jgi:hypothetical protein
VGLGVLWTLLLDSVGRAENDAASLDRLHDVVSPPPVSWWPVAPGWYAVVLALAVLLVGLLWRECARRKRNRYRVEALAELATLRTESLDEAEVAVRLMLLLKRTALTVYPREDLACLSGEAWWCYLDERAAEACFANGVGAALEQRVYGGGSPASEALPIEAALRAAETWIRGHRPISSDERVGSGVDARERVDAQGHA